MHARPGAAPAGADSHAVASAWPRPARAPGDGQVSDRYDPLEDLTELERESLRDWHAHFEGKYDYIGWLITDERS